MHFTIKQTTPAPTNQITPTMGLVKCTVIKDTIDNQTAIITKIATLISSYI